MAWSPYIYGIPYEAKKAAEEATKAIKEELQQIKPDINKINRLNEARFMPGLFSDVYGYYARFRSPW